MRLRQSFIACKLGSSEGGMQELLGVEQDVALPRDFELFAGSEVISVMQPLSPTVEGLDRDGCAPDAYSRVLRLGRIACAGSARRARSVRLGEVAGDQDGSVSPWR